MLKAKKKHIPLTETVSPADFHSVSLRILGAGVHTSRRSRQGSRCVHHNAGMLVYIGQRPHVIKKGDQVGKLRMFKPNLQQSDTAKLRLAVVVLYNQTGFALER